MPRKPSGRPRGRPVGTGMLGEHTRRLTFRIPMPLYDQLLAFAEGVRYTRGDPELARTLRDALEHFLTCPYKRQTEKTIENIVDIEKVEELQTHDATIIQQTEKISISVDDKRQKDHRSQKEKEDGQERQNTEQTANTPGETTPPFDSELYYLGRGPCSREKHSWGTTGKALMLKSARHCAACRGKLPGVIILSAL